jgi:hypothetical protein
MSQVVGRGPGRRQVSRRRPLQLDLLSCERPPPDLLTLQDVLRRMAGRATRTHLNRGEALYINQSRR